MRHDAESEDSSKRRKGFFNKRREIEVGASEDKIKG